jgi:hypothetical protein
MIEGVKSERRGQTLRAESQHSGAPSLRSYPRERAEHRCRLYESMPGDRPRGLMTRGLGLTR